MPSFHSLAQELNVLLEEHHPELFSMLSKRGKAMYFPKKGILGQAEETKGKRLNATIGIALNDDKSPMRLASAAALVNIDPSSVFPYAPAAGIAQLRKVWSELMKSKNPSLKSTCTSPVVTGGLTHALSIAGLLFCDPGDSVLVQFPFWDNYELIFQDTYGAKLAPFPLFKDEAFNIHALREELESRKGKQILLLNFPNNPTGYTPTNKEADAIVAAIKESAERGNNVIVLIDDAYFGLVYEEGIFRESLFGKLASLHERVLAVKIDGASKEEYAWGLRVGFLTYGSKGLSKEGCYFFEEKTSGCVRATLSNASRLSQELILEALKSKTYAEEKEHNFNVLKSRYIKSKELLSQRDFSNILHMLPCNSGYFLCVSMPKGVDAELVRQTLLSEYDTGVISLGNSLIRIAFSSVPEENLVELFTNIREAARKQMK